MYNDNFYKAYGQYLKEKSVRNAHDWVFNTIAHTDFQKTVDLGCGDFNEFCEYSNCRQYLGIDVNVASMQSDSKKLVKGNYRTDDLAFLVGGFYPNAFVSLFSTEITSDYKTNYELYHKIFKTLPVQYGLVSGFYYSDRKEDVKVKEAGGVVSYQTLEPLESVYSSVFSEKRITIHVPSEMFGENVYEVWKLFERR